MRAKNENLLMNTKFYKKKSLLIANHIFREIKQFPYLANIIFGLPKNFVNVSFG